jgi:hypothetical protein
MIVSWRFTGRNQVSERQIEHGIVGIRAKHLLGSKQMPSRSFPFTTVTGNLAQFEGDVSMSVHLLGLGKLDH